MLSVPQLLVILAIVLVLFGAKKLRNIGADLGGAIKNFRKSVKENEDDVANKVNDATDASRPQGQVIEAEHVTVKDQDKA
jgi:sec-independent protein translocase protein TatA